MFIKMDKVCLSLGARKILERFDLSIKMGESVLLTGDCNLRKRAVLRLIAGRIEPESGLVSVDRRPAALGRGTVYLPAKPSLIPHRTLLGNLCLPLQLRGFDTAHAELIAREYLKLFELQRFEDYYPSQLSTDIICRAAVAEAGVFPAKVLLLECPTANIAPENRRQVRRYLNSLRLDGKTLVLMTDDPNESDELVDRAVTVS